MATDRSDQIPTLHIDCSETGGFAELRPYTEVIVFVTVADEAQALWKVQKSRVIQVLNHFLALYRIVTQDPWVFPIDDELDLYLVDSAMGAVPNDMQESPPDQVLLTLLPPSTRLDLSVSTAIVKVGIGPEIFLDFLSGQWFCIHVPLPVLTAQAEKCISVFLGLDSFGRYVQVQALRQLRNTSDQLSRMGVFVEAKYKGTVDLDGVERILAYTA